jgi:hypothetical protein
MNGVYARTPFGACNCKMYVPSGTAATSMEDEARCNFPLATVEPVTLTMRYSAVRKGRYTRWRIDPTGFG